MLKRLPSLSKLLKELNSYQKEYLIFISSLVVAGAIGTVALGFFLKILEDLYGQGLRQFDESVFELIYTLRSEPFTRIVTFVTHLGGALAYFVFIPFIALWLYYKGYNWKIPLQSVIVLFTAFLLNVGLKYFIARPRPGINLRLVEAYSYSFPSGHSMSAMAFYGFLVYLVFKYTKSKRRKALAFIVLVGLVIAIGISRIYLGVHYATDVMAGFVVGLSWLMICIMAIRSIEFYRKKNRVSNPNTNH